MQMQKGICIEQKDDRSIFILPNGQFVKGVPTTELAVGEEGYFYPRVAKTMFARKLIWAPALTVFAVLVILFSVFSPPEEAYAYVQVQINPGVELGIGEDGQIINLRGLNDDGEELATKLKKWKNQPLDRVLEQILSLSVKNSTEEITITTVSEKNAGLPLEAMVKNVSFKTVEDDVEVRLKKATKAQWRNSIKKNIPVSQLVSDSTLVKSEKPLLYPKKEKTEKVALKTKLKREPKKEQKKQHKAIEKPEKLVEKLKEPHSSNVRQKELTPPQQIKASPKTEEKEKTMPKAQDKKNISPKENVKKTPPQAKEKKKETPSQANGKQQETSPQAKGKKNETPPQDKEKKKETSPQVKEKKKEEPKPDAKKKAVEKKKPKTYKKEQKPNKQLQKTKGNKEKKE